MTNHSSDVASREMELINSVFMGGNEKPAPSFVRLSYFLTKGLIVSTLAAIGVGNTKDTISTTN